MVRLVTELLIWWGWMPALYGLGWCLRIVTPGHRFAQSADQWLYANLLSAGGWLWVWLTVCFLGSVIIAVHAAAEDHVASWAGVATAVLAALLAVAAFTQAWRVTWDNDKDLARYYAPATVFYAPALAGPGASPSLDRPVTGAHAGAGGRALAGADDVPSCVRAGTLSTAGWAARVSSYNGAIYLLSRSSADMQNVSLNELTVEYLNAWQGHPARRSGVLDGTGISQGMGGVAEWDGSKVTTCTFSGRYAIDRSFGGTNLADLPDYLAQSYPGLRWTIGDVWGYCDGTQPVVVIPVTKMVRFMSRTVNTAAGIIIVRGEAGKTSLTYQASVRAGDLPGPVYPQSLVNTQLAEASWAAGRGSMNNGGFGYQPTDSTAQAGNVADYLLRSATTGRLQWVTPLTLRNSSSELFVAYAVSSADTVTAGLLAPRARVSGRPE